MSASPIAILAAARIERIAAEAGKRRAFVLTLPACDEDCPECYSLLRVDHEGRMLLCPSLPYRALEDGDYEGCRSSYATSGGGWAFHGSLFTV